MGDDDHSARADATRIRRCVEMHGSELIGSGIYTLVAIHMGEMD